jgi:hypothetical protein
MEVMLYIGIARNARIGNIYLVDSAQTIGFIVHQQRKNCIFSIMLDGIELDFMDILNIQKGFIAHQVNCQKKAGIGLAQQIRIKYPDWYEHFYNTYPYLGRADIYHVNDNLRIVSLYAQDRYGFKGLYTDYEALKECLVSLQKQIIHGEPYDIVYFPYGMGCGYGGGDWKIVEGIIKYQFHPNDYKIVKR